MNELAATWPFSSRTDFDLVLLVTAILLAGLGVLVAGFVGLVLDGPVRTIASTAVSSSSSVSGASSTAITARRDQLVVGRLPHGDALWLVAYLRGGSQQLATTLFVAARRAGWLQVRDDGALDVVMDVEPTEPLLARFKTAIARTASTSTTPLADAARDVAPLVRQQGLAADVIRPSSRAVLLRAVAFAGAAVVVAAELTRMAMVEAGLLRGLHLVDLVWWLPGTLLLYGVVVVLGSEATLAQHRQARAYLHWLDGVVAAARADVRAGVDVRDDDLLMVAALDGAQLGASRGRLGLDRVR